MLIRVRMTLTEEALGMMPTDQEIHETYIASKAPDAPSIEEEVEAVGVDGVVEKTMTIFPKLADGVPFLWDYQIKGFFKDSWGMLRRANDEDTGKACKAIKAYKKMIDGLLFIRERKIPIACSGPMGDCQRPLRAATAQGDRVALAHSETVPAGSQFAFTIELLDVGMEKAVRECLDYARLRGFAQWRNSGKGTAVWEELDENGNVIGGKRIPPNCSRHCAWR